MKNRTKQSRTIKLQVRVTDDEAAKIRARADCAGYSVSALGRHALLNKKPPRASRLPPIDRIEIARLIAVLGELAQALREAARIAGPSKCAALIDATHRDIADMGSACLKALGRIK